MFEEELRDDDYVAPGRSNFGTEIDLFAHHDCTEQLLRELRLTGSDANLKESAQDDVERVAEEDADRAAEAEYCSRGVFIHASRLRRRP